MPAVGQAEGVSDERVVALWQDGGAVVVPADEPVLSAFDLGLVRGDGVFETVAVTGGGAPHLDAHLARLERSARLMELADPGRAAWQALVDALLARWSAPVEGAMRLLLTRGLGVGTADDGAGRARPRPRRDRAPAHRGHRRRHAGPGGARDYRATAPWLLGGAKTLSYAVNMAALRHAATQGADDVIFTSLEGQVLEGPTSTVVWSADGVLHTPRRRPASCPGTTMARLFARAAEAGRPTAVTPGTVDDLQAADAVWLCRASALRRRCTRSTASPAATPGCRRAFGTCSPANLGGGAPGSLVGSSLGTLSPPTPRSPVTSPLLGRGSWPEAQRIAASCAARPSAGALLLAAAAVALVWANSPWATPTPALRDTKVGPAALHLDLTLGTWAADGLLAIFFFVAGLELKREFVAGDLRDPRRAALPVAAAVGGMAVPALIFVLVNLGGGRRRCAAGRSRRPPTSRSRSRSSR